MGQIIKYPQLTVEITDEGDQFVADKVLTVQMRLNSKTNVLEVLVPVKEEKEKDDKPKPKPKTGGLYTGLHLSEIKVTECINGEAKLNWQVKAEKTLNKGKNVAKNELECALDAIWDHITVSNKNKNA